MANSAKPKGVMEDGQTDKGRGNSMQFPYNKGGRKTGRVGSPGSVPNSNTEDGNKRVVNDPRLT